MEQKSKHFWKSKKRLIAELECAECNLANSEFSRQVQYERLQQINKYLVEYFAERHSYTERINEILTLKNRGE